MLIVLSPSKTLDFSPVEIKTHSKPRLLAKSKSLVNVLKKKSAADLQQLMSISEKLARMNRTRYQEFEFPFTPKNSKPSIFAFKGDVYMGLEATEFSEKEVEFANEHIRILSGLYGLLKPLDLIQPYRLEMGTKLKSGKHEDLYEFWGDEITNLLNADFENRNSKVLLNLASNEYFDAIHTDKLHANILKIQFREKRNGKLKFITYNAKKARGRLAHLVVKEKIVSPDAMKELAVDDYIFSPEHSEEWDWMFIKS